MNDLNNVILIGRLTRDIELKYSPSGTAVATFSIAVNSKYKDKEEVSYFDIQTWSKQAETCAEYLAKGSKIAVDGRLKQERWEKEGKQVSRIVIVANSIQFLDSKTPSGNILDSGTPVEDLPF